MLQKTQGRPFVLFFQISLVSIMYFCIIFVCFIVYFLLFMMMMMMMMTHRSRHINGTELNQNLKAEPVSKHAWKEESQR